MQKGIKTACVFCLSILTASLSVTTGCNEMSNDWQWETLTTTGQPEARHEAGLISYKGKIYLLGGRGLKPTSVFDPQNNQWKNKATPPLEIHHFQPVVYGNAIYIIGAMTGPWPNEEPLTNILIYYPEKDEFEFGDSIPTHRRRGGAGVVTYNNKIYMVGGITDGHMTGARSWFDEYDPATGQWNTLDNAPMARDHFQAVVVKDRLFTFAGRTTSKATDEDISLTVSHGNVYDFETGKWLPTREFLKIPTKRAGNSAFSWNGQIIMGGGESAAQEVAHSEVEVFDSDDNKWIIWPS
ncbi:MAG: kelch repeat-containing protein, partial [Bacteroidota bacterium]